MLRKFADDYSLEGSINRQAPSQDRIPEFLAVDFFCGAGGATRGLIDAGGYVLAGLDKQEGCKKTYVSNNRNETGDEEYPKFLALDIHPATEEYPSGQQDQAFARLDELINKHRAMFPEVPLLFVVCAPCQPFTKLGRSAMKDKCAAERDRGRGLLAHSCRFIERYMPDLLLSENVAGIRDARYGGVWGDFIERLLQLDYNVMSREVCASNFGIPQYRKRSILCGIKTHPEQVFHPFELPEGDRSASFTTVQDVFDSLPTLEAGQQHETVPNHIAARLSSLNKKRMSHAPPGESNNYLTNTPDGDLSLACHRRATQRAKSKCFSDVYTRMAPNRPSPTITTRCHSITTGRFGHPDVQQLRGISMREAARLQSFRDDYVFHPSTRIDPIARMIGNAAPPKLVRFYAKWMVDTVRNCPRAPAQIGLSFVDRSEPRRNI